MALREHDLFRRYLEALEVDHELLDGSDLQARLGSGVYQAGISIGDGALVQPAARDHHRGAQPGRGDGSAGAGQGQARAW